MDLKTNEIEIGDEFVVLVGDLKGQLLVCDEIEIEDDGYLESYIIIGYPKSYDGSFTFYAIPPEDCLKIVKGIL